MSNLSKQPKLLNFKNLNIEKYEYLLPHKTQNGYYQSICNYRLSKNQILPFYFETPKLKTTSGIVKIENKYYIDFELSQNSDIGLFNNFLMKNDDNNISVCHENSKEWFKQTMPLNVIETYYKSPIIKKANGQLPIFRVRLPSYKGNILTEIYNNRKENIHDISCIQEGDQLIGIMEFSGLMFMSQNFTPCYELHKIKLLKDNDTRLLQSGYIFSDMNDTIDLDNNIKTDNILEDPIIESVTNTNTNTNNVNREMKEFQKDKQHQDKQQQKEPEKQLEIDENFLNIKTVSISPNNKLPTKTLFDMIKETSLKDFIFDDAIFKNNNKLFTKKINLDNIENEKTILVNKQSSDLEKVKILINKPEQNSVPEQNIVLIQQYNIEPKIEIQDINNIDSDIDYNLESPSSPNFENDISYNIDSDLIDENNDNISELDNIENNEDNDNDEENAADNNADNEPNIENENSEDEENSEEEDNSEDEENSEDDKGINFETLDDLEVIVFDE